MTPSIPVPSHPSLTFNRRSFMILGGVGICGALAACGGQSSSEEEETGPLRGTVTMW